MLLIIDNYDSFTYNLVQYIGELGVDSIVFRNDKITLDEIAEKSPDKIIISQDRVPQKKLVYQNHL